MKSNTFDLLPAGLTAAEAGRRLGSFGPNSLPDPVPVRLWQRLARQFMSPLIYVLLLALALDLGLWVHQGMHETPFEAITIALVLIINSGLGAFQESKAEAALARLKAMAQPHVWVQRDRRLVHIAARELVPGDIARLEAGDRVPADGILVAGQALMADEAVLTGESLPLDKPVGANVASGTLIVRGKGYFEVRETGPRSTMGRLAIIISGIETSKTPLERRLATFANQVAVATLALGLVLVVGGIVAEGWARLGTTLVFAVALAVAVVPEGLPAVMTLTLALGVEHLSKRKAIVRRLSAVEALGSVTVIATDKTGTLTENAMHVRAIDAADTERALHAMVLANDAEIAASAGDPLEVALLGYAEAQGTDASQLTADRPRLSTRAFDSDAKFMRVTVAENGGAVSYLKGAPEVLIQRSALSDIGKRDWEQKALSYAREGHRVLALAWRHEERDDDLNFLGLVLLWDPPRPEVPAALKSARAAGIRVIMITGDHPETALAVAREIGIPADRALTGEDIAALTPQARRDALARVNVFARVSAEDKLGIVEALKGHGEIVAVTGDGINDAAALKRADVGVAMGRRGSDVSREVSDLVLMDDNFATIVAAIEEGRSIYENIQKSIRLLFSTNLALALLIIVGLGLSYLFDIRDPAGGMFIPLTAAQLLWINIVADGPPALAMTLDRNPGIMRLPPRPPTSQLLDSASLRFIVITGIAKAVMGIAILLVMPSLGYSQGTTRTAVFLYESMAQLVFAYPARKLHLMPLPNTVLHATVGAGILLQLMTVSLAPLRALLELTPLDSGVVAAIIAATFLSWGVAEAVTRFAVAASRTQPQV